MSDGDYSDDEVAEHVANVMARFAVDPEFAEQCRRAADWARAHGMTDDETVPEFYARLTQEERDEGIAILWPTDKEAS